MPSITRNEKMKYASEINLKYLFMTLFLIYIYFIHNIYAYMCIYLYIYVCACMYYMERQREKKSNRDRKKDEIKEEGVGGERERFALFKLIFRNQGFILRK